MNRTIFSFLLGWSVLIVILIAISKTTLGNRAIYYVLWLSAVILVVTNASFFVNLYGPGTAGSVGP